MWAALPDAGVTVQRPEKPAGRLPDGVALPSARPWSRSQSKWQPRTPGTSANQITPLQTAEEWSLVFDGYDPAREGIRESLCTLGNGYFATRGAAVWATADGTHYPGTYLAGGYDRLRTEIAGRTTENEELVNLPNWLALDVRIGDQDWFDEKTTTLVDYRQELDLRRGLLLRTVRFEDASGRRTLLQEQRLVSMADMHLGALEVTITAENWSGRVTIRSAIDGRIVNAGAKLYQAFNGKHLDPLVAEAVGNDGAYLLVRTRQSDLRIAQGARTQAFLDGRLLETRRTVVKEAGYVGQEFAIDLVQGQTLSMEKLVFLYTSRDYAISECGLEARKAMDRAGRFEAAKADHALIWAHHWHRFDIVIKPADPGFKLDVPMLLRLNMFHLLQTVSVHSIGLDVGIPARGWTGEAYQGHIFWDELFIFPVFNYRIPEITRALLTYRFRRLGEARAAAKSAGHKGAMFPWQSGSDGAEETERAQLEPSFTALGAGQLLPAAPRGKRDRLQRLAVFPGDRGHRVPPVLRRRTDPGHCPFLVKHGGPRMNSADDTRSAG